MKQNKIDKLGLVDTNQYFAGYKILKHIESNKLMLFEELYDAKRGLLYRVDESCKAELASVLRRYKK